MHAANEPKNNSAGFGKVSAFFKVVPKLIFDFFI